jgi:hypothetical protein
MACNQVTTVMLSARGHPWQVNPENKTKAKRVRGQKQIK